LTVEETLLPAADASIAAAVNAGDRRKVRSANRMSFQSRSMKDASGEHYGPFEVARETI
jgi:hypothetical protein